MPTVLNASAVLNELGWTVCSWNIRLCCNSYPTGYTFCKLSVSYKIHAMHFLRTKVHVFIACVILSPVLCVCKTGQDYHYAEVFTNDASIYASVT